MKTILVIDGQGGNIGRQLCEKIRTSLPEANIVAVGTNANATQTMMKAANVKGATGENPVVYCSKKADIIVGPIGLVAANSMLGEITPAMANAISASEAPKVLIPFRQCSIHVAGVSNASMSELVEDAVEKVVHYYNQ